MAQQVINIGTTADDGTGESLRSALDKTNDNFTETYTRIGTAETDIVNLQAGLGEVALILAASDETTALTVGTTKATFRMPFAMTLTEVRASVTTAPTGTALIIDVNQNGTSVVAAERPAILAGSKTSTTSTTPGVISVSALTDDSEITIDIDQVGSTVAGAGLKVTLIGTRA